MTKCRHTNRSTAPQHGYLHENLILENNLMVPIPPVAPETTTNAVIFLGEDENSGVELWRSSGTIETTTRITDLEPGTGDIGLEDIKVYQDKVYFTASTSAEGTELWHTQGTVETTFMLGPMVAGAQVYFSTISAFKGQLKAWLNACEPTIFFGVPRVWEKMEAAIKAIAKSRPAATGIKKKLIDWAKRCGRISATECCPL